MPRPLTKPMAQCLALTIEHGGKLVYFAGGFWSWLHCEKNGNGNPITRFRWVTVEALVQRGEMDFTNWHKNYPIAAQVKVQS